MRRLAVLTSLLTLASCHTPPAGKGGDGGSGSGGTQTGGSGGAQTGGDGGSGGTETGGDGGNAWHERSYDFQLASGCKSASAYCTKTVVPASGDAITLGRTCDVCLHPPPVHLLAPDAALAVAIDRRTGESIKSVTTAGANPRYGAVSLDGSLWVVNRSVSESTFSGPNVVHLDPLGGVLCRAEVPGGAWAVAVDPQTGNAWVGSALGSLVGFDSDAVEGYDWGAYPMCRPVGNPLSLGDPVTGLAIDDRNLAWVASGTRMARRVRLDTGDAFLVFLPVEASDVTLDPANHEALFFGPAAMAVAADPPYDDPKKFARVGFAACVDGFVTQGQEMWCAEAMNITQLDPITLNPSRSKVLDHVARGLVGAPPWLWIPLDAGVVDRFDPVAFSPTEQLVPPGENLVAAGDVAGESLIAFPALQGLWYAEADAGQRVTWTQLAWKAKVPQGASLVASVRFAQQESDLHKQPASCADAASPIDLTQCPGSVGARFVGVALNLKTSPSGDAPVVDHVQVDFLEP